MKRIKSFFVAAVLSAAALAQQSGDHQSVDTLSRSSQERLTQSIDELNRLRDQIATEKLPLAQELTSLEERLSALRREHDQVTRTIDEGNLEITTLKAEMKAREDELSYIGNLLDEYARTLESKINPVELQDCGEAIESAKQATEDPGLTRAERFARQLSLVDRSLLRLFDSVGGLRFPGVAVDLQGAVLEGQFALIGPVALFRAANGVAGLVVSQSGSTKPLIRPLEGALQSGLAALVQDGEGTLPLDPSRGGALKALVQKTNLIHIFEKGGPIMWPLLVASILALGTVLERLFFLMREKVKRDPAALDAFFAAVTQGKLDDAIRIGQGTKFYVVRSLAYALQHKEQSLPNALLYSQAQELKRFRRGIPILDTVITLAPLLGLLGTVTGMMGSFSLIGGELSAPGAITGGIAEALIATAFGLGIAITALIPFNYLNARTDDAQHEIESASTQLELLVQPQPAVVIAAPPVNGSAEAAEVVREHVLHPADEQQRREREQQRKRLAIERQIAELQRELDGHTGDKPQRVGNS